MGGWNGHVKHYSRNFSNEYVAVHEENSKTVRASTFHKNHAKWNGGTILLNQKPEWTFTHTRTHQISAISLHIRFLEKMLLIWFDSIRFMIGITYEAILWYLPNFAIRTTTHKSMLCIVMWFLDDFSVVHR